MNLNCPLVSICIPAHNCEKYIGETLQCLLKQTYHNIEVIVIDDGSNDATTAVIEVFNDDRLFCVKQSNKGAAAARNAAYNLSKGDYIKFMDADDLLNEVAIEQQVAILSGKTDCIASSKWGRFFNDDRKTFSFTEENVWKNMTGIDWVVQSLITHGSNMTQPGIFLIPRTHIQRFGLWNESLSLIDDFEFMTRMLVNARQVLFCKDTVLMYRSGMVNSLSRANSAQHMLSAFNAELLGVNEILKVRNDAESRLACANSMQLWAYCFYKKHNDLYDQISIEIKKLGGSNIKIRGGKLFELIARIIGWQKAVDFKFFLLKITGKNNFNGLG